MLDIQGAVYSRLYADATLGGLIASYGGVAAVFSDPVPDNIEIGASPVVVVATPFLNEADDTFSEDYRTPSLNVRLYHRPSGSTLALDTAAERVRTLLKSWPTGAITGGSLVDATVTGPVGAPTEDPSLEGRLLTVRLIIQET